MVIEQSAKDSCYMAIKHLRDAVDQENIGTFLEYLTDALEEINNAMACTAIAIREEYSLKPMGI